MTRRAPTEPVMLATALLLCALVLGAAVLALASGRFANSQAFGARLASRA